MDLSFVRTPLQVLCSKLKDEEIAFLKKIFDQIETSKEFTLTIYNVIPNVDARLICFILSSLGWDANYDWITNNIVISFK